MTLGRLGAVCLAAVIFLACGLAPRGRVLAAGLPPIFVVSGVAVDATADSAANARVKALAVGREEAFNRLLRRLTLRSDWARLPILDQAGLDSVVLGIEIGDERTSPTRYLAKLTVSFQPNQVRALLRGKGIPFSETVARPALVLPVWRTGEQAVLWEDPNPWRAAWAKVDLSKGLRPLLSPLGDLEDMAAAGAEAAVAGDTGKLMALARRYGAAEVVVAVAQPSAAGLDIALTTYGDDQPPSTRVSSVAGAGPGLVDQAVQVVAGDLDDSWKQQTILRFGEVASLTVRVSFQNLAEWQQVRNRLARTAEVRKVDILALSTREADVTLRYLGDPQHLALALAQRDLELGVANPATPDAPTPLRLRGGTMGEGPQPGQPVTGTQSGTATAPPSTTSPQEPATSAAPAPAPAIPAPPAQPAPPSMPASQ